MKRGGSLFVEEMERGEWEKVVKWGNGEGGGGEGGCSLFLYEMEREGGGGGGGDFVKIGQFLDQRRGKGAG